MGRKAIGWKNLWSLTVLVFLRLKPMHPYELQSIIRITHKDDVEDLIEKGRDLEKMVLSRAVRWHVENRILLDGNRTVIFE